jgi:O-antigen ligase
MTDRIWGSVTAVYIVACFLLGGASAAGVAANGLLQLVGAALIIAIAWRARSGASPGPGTRSIVLIGGAFILLGLAQLVPIPATLWAGLPGREPIARSLQLIGADAPALALSLSPRQTVASLLALIPPLAIFFLVLRLPSRERRRVAAAVLGIAIASVVLGAFQIMGGETSPLRFYAITNPTSPVGFFANKNHLATLLLCALPLAAALGGRNAAPSGERSRRHVSKIVYGAIAGFLLIGIAINGSMAGYGLLLPAGFAALLIYRREAQGRVAGVAMLVLAGLLAAFLAFAAFGPIGSESLASKFSNSPSSRQVMTARTLVAASDHFPVGTGLGSFQPVYRTYEDPADASRQFVNHAHNDFAEIALELGLAGMLLVAAFLLWWGRRSLAAWRGEFSGAALARAGSVIVGVVLFHSLVDYPLRTSAIATLFAAACAMLLQAPISEVKTRRSGAGRSEGGVRHLEAD